MPEDWVFGLSRGERRGLLGGPVRIRRVPPRGPRQSRRRPCRRNGPEFFRGDRRLDRPESGHVHLGRRHWSSLSLLRFEEVDCPCANSAATALFVGGAYHQLQPIVSREIVQDNHGMPKAIGIVFPEMTPASPGDRRPLVGKLSRGANATWLASGVPKSSPFSPRAIAQSFPRGIVSFQQQSAAHGIGDSGLKSWRRSGGSRGCWENFRRSRLPCKIRGTREEALWLPRGESVASV